jgi:hypothetical protein
VHAAAPNVTVLAYEFTGGALTATSELGVSGSTITAQGVTIVPEDDVPNSITLEPGAAAFNASTYITWTVTPESAIAGFNQLEIAATKGGPVNPRGFYVRSSRDGYTANLMEVTLTTVYYEEGFVKYTAALGTAFIGLTAPVTFRLYPFSPAFYYFVDLDYIRHIYVPPATVRIRWKGM